MLCRRRGTEKVSCTLIKTEQQNATTNSVMLWNEVGSYQSQQHLLCFEKLYYKHGKVYDLHGVMSMLGQRGIGPQLGEHKTRIPINSLSQNSPTISLRSRQSPGCPDCFHHLLFLNYDVPFYLLNTEVFQDTKESLAYLVTLLLRSEQQDSHLDHNRTLAALLPQKLIPSA